MSRGSNIGEAEAERIRSAYLADRRRSRTMTDAIKRTARRSRRSESAVRKVVARGSEPDTRLKTYPSLSYAVGIPAINETGTYVRIPLRTGERLQTAFVTHGSLQITSLGSTELQIHSTGGLKSGSLQVFTYLQ